jgi:hypothetical protein
MDAFGGAVTLTFKFFDAANVLIPGPAGTQQVTTAGGTGVGPIFDVPGATFNFIATGPVKSFVVNGVQAYYALDNFNITPIPEAQTYAMMLGGLAIMGAAMRRRVVKSS